MRYDEHDRSITTSARAVLDETKAVKCFQHCVLILIKKYCLCLLFRFVRQQTERSYCYRMISEQDGVITVFSWDGSHRTPDELTKIHQQSPKASLNGSFMEGFMALSIINFANMTRREKGWSFMGCEESFITMKPI